MKRTRWLLIGLLLLASVGCARRDWVSDILTLGEVTGTWAGSAVCKSGTTTRTVSFGATFRQSGSRVTGQLSSSSSLLLIWNVEVEGAVNGDAISFTGRRVSAEATVDGDEITGSLREQGLCAANAFNTSQFSLRRESSGRPGPPAR